MKFIKSNAYLKTFLTIILLSFLALLLVTPSYAELTVESYCQLTIESARQEISNLNEFIALAQQYSEDKEIFLQQEEVKFQEFGSQKESLFSSFGTTSEEYLSFMGGNRKAVEEYLKIRLDYKDTIDELSNQVKALLEEYELLRESIVNSPPPLE